MVRSAVGSPREVVFVDGVRTPFGKAGSRYATTRADDLIVKVIRELLRRNPSLPPERIDEVAIAATTQIGDQGLTLGRSAGILAGLPQSVPGYSIDRMCAGAMTAVTSLGAGIAAGAIDVGLAGGVEHMGRHPMGEGIDPNPRFVAERLVNPDALGHGQDRREPARPVPAPHPRTRRRLCRREPAEGGRRVHRRRHPARSRTGRGMGRRRWLGPVDHRRAPASWHHHRHLGRAADAVPTARTCDGRKRSGAQRRRDRCPRHLNRHRRRTRPRTQDAHGRLRLRRRRPGADGSRTDPVHRARTEPSRPVDRRHRTDRDQRGIRRAGAGIPRPLRHR